MSSKRINVLIYSGTGATISSVRHATWSLRRLLGPNYAIITITAEQLLKEPWTASCALLVMPGGADLGYCRMLNGEGNRRIKRFVQMGGAYLGLCAGGYYGSAKCEFEVGRKAMEVIGERELAFYPDTCRGLAFPGFVYASEAGARAVELQVNGAALGEAGAEVPHTFRSYYNGGGVFVNGEDHKERGVEVLASYGEKLAVDSGGGKAAVVYCKVGDGNVILTGPHPEFAGANLDRDQPNAPGYAATVDAILADDKARTGFLRACLVKLGLEVSPNTESVPSLSRLHLSAAKPSEVSELVHAWQEACLVSKDSDGVEWMLCENDNFCLEQVGRWNMANVQSAVADALPQAVKDALPEIIAPASATTSMKKENEVPAKARTHADGSSSVDRALDYNSLTKHLVAHETELPDGKETPHFNHHAYYANLKVYAQQHAKESRGTWGKTLLYGEVVTSTNTLLEKNPSLLAHLPAGFTATATTQVAGRGRGNNVWVSPHGSLMFSTVLRHPLVLSSTAPVVFVQYLAAMAVVNAIHSYDKGGYSHLPIKLKWPNDIYALDPQAAVVPPSSSDRSSTPTPSQEARYAKIAGILVNSSYSGGDYTLVTGIGLNVLNARPSTSLTHLTTHHHLAPFALEKLLAGIIVHFEELYTRFCRTGFDAHFEDMYYGMWLHTDQIVNLETEGGVRARIKGITRDWGLLVAEEVDREGRVRGAGRRFEVQSDSNSFDFFRGLVRKKT